MDRRQTYAHARSYRQANGRLQQILGGQRGFQGVRNNESVFLKVYSIPRRDGAANLNDMKEMLAGLPQYQEQREKVK